MEIFLLIYGIVILALIVIFDVYMFHELWCNFRTKNPPFVPTVGKQRRIIVAEVSKFLSQAKTTCKIIDPGCGTANMLLELAKKFPQHQFVGIELNKFWWRIANFRARNLDNVQIVHNDMFKESFANADVMLCFIFDKLIPKLSAKIVAEAKPEVQVYSNGFKFPELALQQEFECKKSLFRHSVYFYEVAK